jgi:hypothetical protein
MSLEERDNGDGEDSGSFTAVYILEKCDIWAPTRKDTKKQILAFHVQGSARKPMSPSPTILFEFVWKLPGVVDAYTGIMKHATDRLTLAKWQGILPPGYELRNPPKRSVINSIESGGGGIGKGGGVSSRSRYNDNDDDTNHHHHHDDDRQEEEGDTVAEFKSIAVEAMRLLEDAEGVVDDGESGEGGGEGGGGGGNSNNKAKEGRQGRRRGGYHRSFAEREAKMFGAYTRRLTILSKLQSHPDIEERIHLLHENTDLKKKKTAPKKKRLTTTTTALLPRGSSRRTDEHQSSLPPPPPLSRDHDDEEEEEGDDDYGDEPTSYSQFAFRAPFASSLGEEENAYTTSRDRRHQQQPLTGIRRIHREGEGN